MRQRLLCIGIVLAVSVPASARDPADWEGINPNIVFYLRSVILDCAGKTVLLTRFTCTNKDYVPLSNGRQIEYRVEGRLEIRKVIWGKVTDKEFLVNWSHHGSDARKSLPDDLRWHFEENNRLLLVLPDDMVDLKRAIDWWCIPVEHEEEFCTAVDFVKANADGIKDKANFKKIALASKNPFLVCSMRDLIGERDDYRDFLDIGHDQLRGAFLFCVARKVLSNTWRSSLPEWVREGSLSEKECLDYFAALIRSSRDLGQLAPLVLALCSERYVPGRKGLLISAMELVKKEKAQMLCEHPDSKVVTWLQEIAEATR
jgi:hypothetical protein